MNSEHLNFVFSILKTPLVTWRCSEEGLVTENIYKNYELEFEKRRRIVFLVIYIQNAGSSTAMFNLHRCSAEKKLIIVSHK